MTEPAVDVLMTVYNGAPYVRSSVESLLGQTFTDFRIHIVDDGSNDDTPAILADLAANDARIQVHGKPNGGVVEAANFGLARCTAEFVARMDADDLAYSDRLERQVGILRARPDVLAVSGGARHIDESGKRLVTRAKFGDTAKADPRHVPAIEPYLLHPFVMIRREALARVGGYRDLVVSEDSDLYWRLQEIGGLHNDARLYGDYRMNPGSLSSQSVRGGRIMAIFSQLAALSALRRRCGQPDLEFSRAYGADIRAKAGALDAACQAAAVGLSEEEARHLRFAAGVKLLEMASYRPYEIDRSDCEFLRRVFGESAARLVGTNRGIVLRNYSGTSARLAADGNWDEAWILLQPGMRVGFLFRYLLRKIMPKKVHRRVRIFLGPILYWMRGA